MFPKIPKLDDQSREQATDTRATGSRYLEEANKRSTLKERHARGKRIIENKKVPTLDLPLVSCGADSSQTPTISAVMDAAREQTSNSFMSGTLEFIETHPLSVHRGRKYILK